MPPSDALLTDLYCLTMAADYVHEGAADDIVTFELSARSDRPLTVAGVHEALAFLEDMRFTDADLRWLAEQDPVTFDGPVLARLRALRFGGRVWAIREGTIVPAATPLLRLTATRLEATLVESPLLAAVNYAVRVATNATEIVRAAAGRPVWDFSMRRLDGIAAAHSAARAAYLAGFAGTATTAAARDLGIPATGTMAHAKVMARGRAGELDVFSDQLRARPAGATLLVDTYDTLEGVRRAIRAQRLTGGRLKAIRIDSGDLGALAIAARELLDAAGLQTTRIILTGDLDAERIGAFVAAGVPAGAFGVGSKLRGGEPLSAVYKLVEQPGEQDPALRHTMKLSPGKVNDPGAHQVTRRADGTHLLHLADEAFDGVALLTEVMRDGARTARAPDLAADREHAAGERDATNGTIAPLDRSPRLRELSARLAAGAGGVHAAGEPAPDPGTALVAVDVQHDFLPGGALGVAGGDAVVAPLVAAAGDVALVVKTRDAHPAGHCSFVAQGGTWPPHCVVGTHGAELHPAIAALPGPVIDKATAVEPDSYSGFQDTGLAALLRDAGITHVLIGGLATDYCVKVTVLDALAAGFAVTVLAEAIAAVDVEPGDGERALAEMVAAGARVAEPERRPGQSPDEPGPRSFARVREGVAVPPMG
jgi:putative nicotinate phosphoribosyltransferase